MRIEMRKKRTKEMRKKETGCFGMYTHCSNDHDNKV